MSLINEIRIAQRNAGEDAVIRNLERQGLGSIGPYASEAETQALMVPDTRMKAERKLARIMAERGADEQGAETYPILSQIAVELLAEQPAQQQEPVAFSQFLSDVVTAAGLLSHGKTDKSLAARISEFAFRLRTSPQPAQRKPLTDDPLQGAVDWLLEADGEYFCTATVQRTLRIGYNRAKRLCDTAKERAAHGIKGDA